MLDRFRLDPREVVFNQVFLGAIFIGIVIDIFLDRWLLSVTFRVDASGVCSYTQDVPHQPCDPSFDQVSTKCYMHRKVERRKTTTQNSYSGKFSKTWLVFNLMEKLDHQQISATNHNPSVWSNTWLIAVCLKAHDPSLSEICQKWTSCPNPFPW